jgi:hypothetical protein
MVDACVCPALVHEQYSQARTLQPVVLRQQVQQQQVVVAAPTCPEPALHRVQTAMPLKVGCQAPEEHKEEQFGGSRLDGDAPVCERVTGGRATAFEHRADNCQGPFRGHTPTAQYHIELRCQLGSPLPCWVVLATEHFF